METVGAATWSHSLKALRPGGTVVIAGATSGPNPTATELNRIFFLQLRIVGSTMGTRDELERLVSFCRLTGVRPVVDTVLPHPFYAPLHWVCVVNPGERSRPQLADLLERAHALARRRYENRDLRR